jgi:hypothetical protein
MNSTGTGAGTFSALLRSTPAWTRVVTLASIASSRYASLAAHTHYFQHVVVVDKHALSRLHNTKRVAQRHLCVYHQVAATLGDARGRVCVGSVVVWVASCPCLNGRWGSPMPTGVCRGFTLGQSKSILQATVWQRVPVPYPFPFCFLRWYDSVRVRGLLAMFVNQASM